MMYNPQLDTFICVVEAGSFSKAADKLYISPPAVIKQINSLENNLGVQLFARTHRGLVVTAAGESLYQDAKYMVNYSKEAIERAKEAGNDEDDVIRVGISPMTPPQVFVELWPRIQEQYPNILRGGETMEVKGFFPAYRKNRRLVKYFFKFKKLL